MADDQQATNVIFYSWNEGLTWETYRFSDKPVEVRNIITEPSNTAEKFVIYGRTSEAKPRGFIAAVDFGPLHKRWCQGIDTPDTAESDYETWSPNGLVSADCLLGRKIKYIRKKRSAECFNSEEHERWQFLEHCACTEEDWECDLGYYRKDINQPCTKVDSYNHTVPKPPENCKGHWYMTQGYRKVAGDSCRNGVDHSELKQSCPGVSNLSGSNLFVLASLCSIIFGLIWVSKKGNYDRLKSQATEIAGNLLKSVKSKSPHKPATGSGWVPLDTAIGKDDDEFKLQFESNEEDDRAEIIEDNNLREVAQGKRKTEGRGLDAATKRVPILNKPGKTSEYDVGI
jgi:hypothetical protein